MNFLGNLIWLIMGGLITALMYWVAGVLLCLTIIGIPFGVQLFKIGNMVLWPFGHDLVPKENASGCLNIFFNIRTFSINMNVHVVAVNGQRR